MNERWGAGRRKGQGGGGAGEGAEEEEGAGRGGPQLKMRRAPPHMTAGSAPSPAPGSLPALLPATLSTPPRTQLESKCLLQD